MGIYLQLNMVKYTILCYFTKHKAPTLWCMACGLLKYKMYKMNNMLIYIGMINYINLPSCSRGFFLDPLLYIFHLHILTIIERSPKFVEAIGQHVMAIFSFKTLPHKKKIIDFRMKFFNLIG